MEISASEIQFSAQHHAVQKHIRSETFVEGFSSPGAWDPESLESSNSVSREQTQSDPFFTAPHWSEKAEVTFQLILVGLI